MSSLSTLDERLMAAGSMLEGSIGGHVVLDLMFVAISLLFFAISIGYVALCDRLMK
jgi:hypothetical protein